MKTTTTKGESIAAAIARLRGDGYKGHPGYPIDRAMVEGRGCEKCGEPLAYVAFQRCDATGHVRAYTALAACRKCGTAREV